MGRTIEKVFVINRKLFVIATDDTFWHGYSSNTAKDGWVWCRIPDLPQGEKDA